MSKLPLSLSVCNYDRTAALFDGRVAIEGCDANLVALAPEESFHRAIGPPVDIDARDELRVRSGFADERAILRGDFAFTLQNVNLHGVLVIHDGRKFLFCDR